jgi:predicted aspartyl protease
VSLLGRFVAEFDTPKLEFTISDPIRLTPPMKVVGIIDTGASRLCIPESLAKRIGLKPIRTSPTTTASGVILSTIYAARITFAALNYSENIEVVAPQTPDYEPPILIGMSVLRQFNIWYHGGLETWSFYRREKD